MISSESIWLIKITLRIHLSSSSTSKKTCSAYSSIAAAEWTKKKQRETSKFSYNIPGREKSPRIKHKTSVLPIIRRDTVRWSRPAGLMAPKAVPTKTQQTATRAIMAMNHRSEPGFQASNPQQPFGGSSVNRPLQQNKTLVERHDH